ncbi:hypothetical protein [Mesorhizobium sp. M1399]|uniref:hypothetical protein n=1 Tax=Mesorhizobium sp. M1399 TaxID=2957096 RepID=UPI00333C9492
MAGKSEGGIREALQLDQAAKDLLEERAGGAGNPADPAAEQLGLFSSRSVFGEIKDPQGEVPKLGGPGRPRGPSRVTRDLVKLIESTGRHPILAMAEIVATPIDVIAKTLGCKKIEAAEYHRKVMSDLAPYVAQRLPLAVQLQGATAGMLVINMGGPVGEGAIGLDMKLVEGIQIDAEKLNGINDDSGAPHDSAPHEEAK